MSMLDHRTIGQYQIVSRLGQGGMATVYKAYHSRLNRYVAIKTIHSAFVDDSAFIARFEREAQIIASLEHPNIVPVHDFFEADGTLCLVMKYIEGMTLRGVLAEGPLFLEDTLNVMTAIASAVDYAHSKGVLHRDIKPSNILLDHAGVPYVSDFGLARLSESGAATYSQGIMIGTPHYMSPEQARGADLTAASDLYSLGIVLYELVTGRVPYHEGTPYAIIAKHIQESPPFPSTLNATVSPLVDGVLLTALAKNPADRYPSATAMIRAFRAAIGDDELVVPSMDGRPSHAIAQSMVKRRTDDPSPAVDERASMAVKPTTQNDPIAAVKRSHVWVAGVAMLVLFFVVIVTALVMNQAQPQTAIANPVMTAEVSLGANADAAPRRLALLTLPVANLEEAQLMVNTFPEDQLVYLTLAREYLRDGQRLEGGTTLQTGAIYADDPVVYYATSGVEAVSLDQPIAAIYSFALALDVVTPDSEQFFQLRGLVGTEVYPLIIEHGVITESELFAVLRLPDELEFYQHPLIITLIARLALQNGDSQSARRLIDQVITQDAARLEAMLVLAEIELAEGNTAAAQSWFDTILSGIPAPPWVLARATQLDAAN